MEKLGLLAGVGHLPAACARAARAQGFEVHVIALLPDCDPDLKEAASVYREISIGSIASILAYLQQEEIKKVTMIGKVTKELLFTGQVQPDEMLRGMLMQLPNQNDDTIMMMFVGALMKVGARSDGTHPSADAFGGGVDEPRTERCGACGYGVWSFDGARDRPARCWADCCGEGSRGHGARGD